MPDQIPNLESTAYASDVIYLVRKVGSPEEYTRVSDFRVFNTEARA